MWAQTDSNRRPSACKADALNQLSYAPVLRYEKVFRVGADGFEPPTLCL